MSEQKVKPITVILAEVNKAPVLLESVDFDLGPVRRLIGCRMVEVIATIEGSTIWCDEEARLTGVEFNRNAIVRLGGEYSVIDILGTIVVTGDGDRHGNTKSVRVSAIPHLMRMLALPQSDVELHSWATRLNQAKKKGS